MPRTSVFYPFEVTDARAVLPFAELVRRGPLERLWLGQSTSVETHHVLAYLAGAGMTVPMGTAVTLLPLRNPYEAALEARSLAALTEHPFVAGFGSSWELFVTSVEGKPYASPRRAMHEYLSCVRTLIDGEVAEVQGEYVNLRSVLGPMAHPGVEVGAGVLRPAMARTAGAVADVAITTLTPPAYVRDVLVPALRTGAEGRERVPRVVTLVHAATEQPGRDPLHLAKTGAIRHMGLPHYGAMLRSAGLEFDVADQDGCAAALIEAGLFLTGSPEHIAAELHRYREAGADEVVLNPCGVLVAEGQDAALRDLELISAAL
ncbi:hypothetical protein GCM10022247_72070 [Allokutzneria multivorans]|uniref:Luciferase-like domain-containing protein n=1 Tax=Allokutzneria multivorans TaxID=1142134 RepID=A0ABP7U4Z1_9PSEU